MIAAGPPTIDPAQLNDLKEMFPDGAAQLDAIAGLLEQPPTGERAAELFDKMREFSAATGRRFQRRRSRAVEPAGNA